MKGLTDKESLEILMQESRAERQTYARVRELAVKGMHDPDRLTREETRELCSSVVQLHDRRVAR